MNNFGHIEAKYVIFFWKCWKSYVDFETQIKLRENIDGFKDYSFWTCCKSFCQLWQEYIWMVVDVLKSGNKISARTKRDDTQLNLFDLNGTEA